MDALLVRQYELLMCFGAGTGGGSRRNISMKEGQPSMRQREGITVGTWCICGTLCALAWDKRKVTLLVRDASKRYCVS